MTRLLGARLWDRDECHLFVDLVHAGGTELRCPRDNAPVAIHKTEGLGLGYEFHRLACTECEGELFIADDMESRSR